MSQRIQNQMQQHRYDSDASFRLEKRKLAFKRKAWEGLVKAFRARQRDGLTQVEFARLVDKKPEQVSRSLKRPQNFTFDTFITYLSALEMYPEISIKDPTDPAQCSNESIALARPIFRGIILRGDEYTTNSTVIDGTTSAPITNKTIEYVSG